LKPDKAIIGEIYKAALTAFITYGTNIIFGRALAQRYSECNTAPMRIYISR
jgi:hypothetical protein